MWPGGGRASTASVYLPPVGIGCCPVSFLLYCVGVPLVVYHVNSSQRGTVSTLLFRRALCFVSPICALAGSPPPPHTDCWRACPSSGLTAYWGFKVPAEKRGSHSSLTPPSQWAQLTMGQSPSHSFPCQAGKSKYLSTPTTMAGAEEKRTDQNTCKYVGEAAVSQSLNTDCRSTNKESPTWCWGWFSDSISSSLTLIHCPSCRKASLFTC